METKKQKSMDAKTRVALILARLENESQILQAARNLATGNDYCDFFVENNNGGPFHEVCGSDPFLGLSIKATEFSARRMSGLSKYRAAASDDYPDFFVEGS